MGIRLNKRRPDIYVKVQFVCVCMWEGSDWFVLLFGVNLCPDQEGWRDVYQLHGYPHEDE